MGSTSTTETLFCERCKGYFTTNLIYTIKHTGLCNNCYNKIREPRYHKKPYTKLISCDICFRNKHNIWVGTDNDFNTCTTCIAKTDLYNHFTQAQIIRALTNYYYKRNYIKYGEKELWREYAFKKDYEKYNKYFLRCEDV